MDSTNSFVNNKQTKQKLISMSTTTYHDNDPDENKTSWSSSVCIICGSKAIGMNFGVPTCAPCKAFFRRNARRKEILETPCHHSNQDTIDEKLINVNNKTVRYLQIRRCSSCRLHRCFEVGMKEELVRTEEENERHKKLVETNRKRRELIKQQQEKESQIFTPQRSVNNSDLLSEVDWRHFSNIVYAYDTCCLKLYVEQRAKMVIDETLDKRQFVDQCMMFPISVTLSLYSFVKSLPAFQSLSRSVQSFLCKNNLRRLIFVNLHELNQSCFSEPWQTVAYRTGWAGVCGPELYEKFIHVENLSGKLIITDPIVTRLWLIALFFSPPLFSYYDPQSSIIKMKKRLSSIDIQNAYAVLLWKYLLHRHGYMESVRIYSNLMQAYLQMLRVGLEIHMRVRTQTDFRVAHATLEQISTLDINNNQ